MNTAILAADWDRLTPRLVEAFQQTLVMVVSTLVVAGFIGLVIGTLLYTTRRGGILQNSVVFTVLNLLINFVRPIPFIILVIALLPLTRAVVGTTIGTTAAIFVMITAASFAIARIVEQNLVSIDPGVIEAARSMGASPWQIIRSVILREALGPLVLGYTFVFIAIVDMSAMAGTIGGGGLGDFAIKYGYQRFDTQVTMVTTLIIILIVQLAQFFGNWLARKIMRR